MMRGASRTKSERPILDVACLIFLFLKHICSADGGANCCAIVPTALPNQLTYASKGYLRPTLLDVALDEFETRAVRYITSQVDVLQCRQACKQGCKYEVRSAPADLTEVSEQRSSCLSGDDDVLLHCSCPRKGVTTIDPELAVIAKERQQARGR